MAATLTKAGKPRKTLGRPPKRSPLLRAKILELYRQGLSVPEIAKRKGIPSARSIERWLAADPEFRREYVHAKLDYAARVFHQLNEIADGCESDSAAVAKAKLRCDVRKWQLSKLLPKVYGDRLEVDHGDRLQVVNLDWSPFTGESPVDADFEESGGGGTAALPNSCDPAHTS